jgi:hypothetical protein
VLLSSLQGEHLAEVFMEPPREIVPQLLIEEVVSGGGRLKVFFCASFRTIHTGEPLKIPHS